MICPCLLVLMCRRVLKRTDGVQTELAVVIASVRLATYRMKIEDVLSVRHNFLTLTLEFLLAHKTTCKTH